VIFLLVLILIFFSVSHSFIFPELARTLFLEVKEKENVKEIHVPLPVLVEMQIYLWLPTLILSAHVLFLTLIHLLIHVT